MSEPKTIKNEKTLIGRLIDNSKEIIKLHNVIHLLSESKVAMALCRYNPIDKTPISALIYEYRQRADELKEHNANIMKAVYSKDYAIIGNKFHLSSAEMAAGYTVLYKKNYKGKNVRCVLFLSDVELPFPLDEIKEGEIKVYDEEIEKNYLNHCKPVWEPSSIRDIRMECLKARLV